jgi:hypothetical protein
MTFPKFSTGLDPSVRRTSIHCAYMSVLSSLKFKPFASLVLQQRLASMESLVIYIWYDSIVRHKPNAFNSYAKGLASSYLTSLITCQVATQTPDTILTQTLVIIWVSGSDWM